MNTLIYSMLALPMFDGRVKKISLIVIGLCIYAIGFSQSGYQTGYFIEKNGQRINCLIKNVDWKNNPTSFKYQLMEGASVLEKSVTEVQEFGILKSSKFVSAIVPLDRSSTLSSKLTENKDPIYKEEAVFLRVIIEGEANLYSFEASNVLQFYYSIGEKEMMSLVYKEYVSANKAINKNENFKYQLSSDLNCATTAALDIRTIEYKEKQLSAFFQKYNKCVGSTSKNYARSQGKTKLAFSIRPGISYSTFTTQSDAIVFAKTIDFGSGIHFRIGIEGEVFFSFNNSRWALLVEPSFSTFKATQTFSSQKVTAKITTIDIPFGLRHYFILEEKSRLFLNAGFIFTVSSNSTIDFESATNLISTVAGNGFIGFGYNRNKISFEIRHNLSRDALAQYLSRNGKYTSSSLIVGFKF